MSKVIAIALLITLALLPLGCTQNQNPPANTATAAAPNSPPNDEMEVTVLFSGLMIFHFNRTTQSYEVGILAAADSPEHEFCVQREGNIPICRDFLPEGPKWILTVTNPTGAPPVQVGHGNARRPDNANGQYDLDWLIDLEGSDFHGRELTLKPGHLVPIIQLPKVQLFTRYKSHDMVRWKGTKPTPPQKPPVFGFVAETIGLRVLLKPNEELVLREDGGSNTEIVKVSYRPSAPVGRNHELISITNVRNPPREDSDFYLYYKLFSDVPASEQYDFDENDGSVERAVPAFNPLPEYSVTWSKTCCMLVCDEVMLGKRQNALE